VGFIDRVECYLFLFTSSDTDDIKRANLEKKERRRKKKEEPAKKNDSSFLANKTTYAAKRKDRKRYVRE